MKYVDVMHGLGDTIYQRPFLKELLSREDDVYVNTSIPQLYNDLGLKFIKPKVEWRTQSKNLSRVDNVDWVENVPEFNPKDIIDPHYGPDRLAKKGLISCIEDSFRVPFRSSLFDLPEFLDPHPIDLPKDRPVAVIKPATVRNEWMVTSRNPKPEYIHWCSKILRQAGWYVISLADTQHGHEWALAPLPEADEAYLCGELNMEQVLDLVRDSDLVLGGSGWIVPAALAANTALFVLFGGRGLFDSPEKILDIRMDLRKAGWALPDKFCRCGNNSHSCNKTISDLDHQFISYIKQLQMDSECFTKIVY